MRMMALLNGRWVDITYLTASAAVSGRLANAARTLRFEVIVSPDDPALPYVFIPPGTAVELFEGENSRFRGVVQGRTKSTKSNTMTVVAYDFGFYLTRSDFTGRFDGVTPEAAAAQLCARYGIPTAGLAATGVPLTRKFNKIKIYAVIDTMYTLAAEQNGKVYVYRFNRAALQIRERSLTTPDHEIIMPRKNLIDATYSDSVEQAVNAVHIFDKDGNEVGSVVDRESIDAYGLRSRNIEQGDADAFAEARELIAEHAFDRSCTLVVLDGSAIRTGDTIQLREPYTGQNGLFWVDADETNWSDGTVKTTLTLSYKAEMREGSAGSDDSEEG